MRTWLGLPLILSLTLITAAGFARSTPSEVPLLNPDVNIDISQSKSALSLFSSENLVLEKRFGEMAPKRIRKLLETDEMDKIRFDSLQIAGGGSSNGGGGGLSYDQNGRLKLITNDYWEIQTYGMIVSVQENESALHYLDRVLETRIKPLDENFYRRLTEAIGEVLLASWNPRSDLPIISDLGELKPMPSDNYKPVQIAVRYSFSNPGFRPEIFIDYDPALLAQLDTQNLAMLILHEAIYVWGTELQQKDSAKVRALVNRILSVKEPIHAQINNVALFSAATRKALFQDEIRRIGFANFINLYEKDTRARSSNDIAARRQLVYASMMEKMRGERGGVPTMTDEESFFYFYYFYSQNPGSDGKTLEQFIQSAGPETQEIQKICSAAKEVKAGRGSFILKMVFEDSFKGILKYCRN